MDTMIVAGVDEAGRGPVVGDMFVALVAMERDSVSMLTKFGVRDSKELSRERREELLKHILKLVRVVVVARATPREIDSTNLNTLFSEKVARCIAIARRKLGTGFVVYVDACGDPSRISMAVKRRLEAMGILDVEIHAMHGADKSIPVVSAASIVAKVLRDRHIDELKKIYGDFGSGYPSDPKTRRWLEQVVSKGEIPPIVRKKWSSVKRLSTKTLLDYLGRNE